MTEKQIKKMRTASLEILKRKLVAKAIREAVHPVSLTIKGKRRWTL